MIGLEARHSRRGLDDIQTVHRLARFKPVTLGIRRCDRQEAREADPAEEVRIERDDHIGVFQLVLRIVEVAEDGLRCSHARIVIDGVVLSQLRLRVLCLHLLPLGGQRG